MSAPSVVAPICLGCTHLRADYACDAFPEGIPDPIMENMADHRAPYAGDRGILFVPVEPWAAERAVDVFGPAPVVDIAERLRAERTPVVELAFDPAQKRDHTGKWTSGGHGGGGGAPSEPGPLSGTPGPTPEGTASQVKLELHAHNVLAAKDQYDTLDMRVRSTSSQLKHDAMVAVAADLEKEFPGERLAKEADAMGAHKTDGEGNYLSEGERVADAMMNTWSISSWNPGAHETVALQKAVADEFGTGLSKDIETTAKNSDPNGDTVEGGFAYALGQHDMPVVRSAVRSMYTHTQAQLDKAGVGDTVTLYRGVRSADMRGDVDIDSHPASSWSSSRAIAKSFAGAMSNNTYRGTVITMTVPRSRVLGMSGSGLGCYEEHELVVMRGKGDSARCEAP